MRVIALLLMAASSLSAMEAIIVDPYFSPFMGGYDLRFVHRALMGVEDRVCRDGDLDRTAKAFGRFFELLVWEPINIVTAVTQHEFFGHGYRLRELGVKPEGYQITPYGGYTAFDLDESFPVGDLLAVSVAGLEAEAVLAHQMKMQWMQKGVIDGRDTTLYTQTELSPFWYTLITALGRLKDNTNEPGNDIEAYIELVNETYPHHHLSLDALTVWASLEWLNPMVFFAYYSWFYYIATGCPWKFPTIELAKGIRYLPSIRIGFAPYAPEAYFENFFSIHGNPLYCYVKAGQRSVGLGVEYDHLFLYKRWMMGLRFDSWWQSQFVSGANVGELDENLPVGMGSNFKVFGVAASLTNRINITAATALFIELGGKSAGYLPGYTLGGSLTARAGIVIGTM